MSRGWLILAVAAVSCGGPSPCTSAEVCPDAIESSATPTEVYCVACHTATVFARIKFDFTATSSENCEVAARDYQVWKVEWCR